MSTNNINTSTSTLPTRRMLGRLAIFAVVAIGGITATLATPQQADAAGQYGRQYYSSWSYHPAARYHYCRYNYRPTVHATTYRYHYVIYYPSRPRYRYYYNPVRRVYWGRYEVDTNGNAVGYSLLAKDDRKSSLKDIPESAFPKASKMPPVPESDDQELMLEPPKDLPSESNAK